MPIYLRQHFEGGQPLGQQQQQQLHKQVNIIKIKQTAKGPINRPYSVGRFGYFYNKTAGLAFGAKAGKPGIGEEEEELLEPMELKSNKPNIERNRSDLYKIIFTL